MHQRSLPLDGWVSLIYNVVGAWAHTRRGTARWRRCTTDHEPISRMVPQKGGATPPRDTAAHTYPNRPARQTHHTMMHPRPLPLDGWVSLIYNVVGAWAHTGRVAARRAARWRRCDGPRAKRRAAWGDRPIVTPTPPQPSRRDATPRGVANHILGNTANRPTNRVPTDRLLRRRCSLRRPNGWRMYEWHKTRPPAGFFQATIRSAEHWHLARQKGAAPKRK